MNVGEYYVLWYTQCCGCCLLCRCKKPPANPVHDEYSTLGSRSGGVVLRNMTKNPSYATSREATTSFAAGTLTNGDKEHTYEVLPCEAGQEVQESYWTFVQSTHMADNTYSMYILHTHCFTCIAGTLDSILSVDIGMWNCGYVGLNIYLQIDYHVN